MNDILPQDTKDVTAADNVGVNSPIIHTPISRGPEGMIITDSVETIAPSNNETANALDEIAPTSENLRLAETPPKTNVGIPTNDQKNVLPPATPNFETTEKKVEVVNRATGKEKLHSIEHPLNDLTTRADLEEEDFIKHVEEIHTLQ